MSGAPARSDLELRLLEGMVDGAHALGMKLVAMAEAERDVRTMFAVTEAFNRCAHAVRMGIRLSISLRAGPKPASADREEPAAERERDRDRPNRPDREEDRDRDRDYEPVSLQRFLATLRGAAGAAERLGVAEAETAELRTLLAEADAGSTAAVAVRPRPAAAPAKARFLATAAHLRPIAAHPRERGDPGFFR